MLDHRRQCRLDALFRPRHKVAQYHLRASGGSIAVALSIREVHRLQALSFGQSVGDLARGEAGVFFYVAGTETKLGQCDSFNASLVLNSESGMSALFHTSRLAVFFCNSKRRGQHCRIESAHINLARIEEYRNARSYLDCC